MTATAIPARIMDYHVTASSPSEELLTLGQIFTEIGNYASTILDSRHSSLARKCFAKLSKITRELTARHKIQSEECLQRIPEGELLRSDLAAMTVSELYDLYRRWPLRHNVRRNQGREAFTFYYEGRIVNELSRRTADNTDEQLKIDYCALSYRNELQNMAFALGLPVGEPKQPCATYLQTTTELSLRLHQAESYTDVHGRELLVELIDSTLDVIMSTTDKASLMLPAAEIIDIGRRHNIATPATLYDFLTDALGAARTNACIRRSQLVLPLLILSMHKHDSTLEHEATLIINDCYRSATSPDFASLSKALADLEVAVTYSDYVSDFDIDQIGRSWNALAAVVVNSAPGTTDTRALLSIAAEIAPYTSLAPTLLSRL